MCRSGCTYTYHLVPQGEYAKECFSTMNFSNMQISFFLPISRSTSTVVFIDTGLFQIRHIGKMGQQSQQWKRMLHNIRLSSQTSSNPPNFVTILTHAWLMFEDTRKRFKNTLGKKKKSLKYFLKESGTYLLVQV